MAKKKSAAAASATATANWQPDEVAHHQKAMTVQSDKIADGNVNVDVAMEKLQNLKSLNAVLVKQAHELRVERSSLMSVNGVLESEKMRLESEKMDVEDLAVRLELEKEVMEVVVAVRVGEMLKCGVRLVDGKEAVEKRLEREVEVLRGEKGSVDRALKELGEYSLDVEKERDALKEKVVKDAEDAVREKDAEIESLKMEISSLNMSLSETFMYGKRLKKRVGGLEMEKREIELEKNEKVAIVEGLEREVCGLRESASGLLAEVGKLKEMVSELEKDNAELLQLRDGLSMEFAGLKEKNEGNEEQIRSLLLDKKRLTRDIDESFSEMDKLMCESQNTTASFLAEITELRDAHKTELRDMQKMACDLKHKLELTQQNCETQIDEKKKLVMELQSLRIELEASIAERVRAQKDIQLEKKNVQCLTQNLVELESKVQESTKEIQQLVNEKSKLVEAKEAVEEQVELLIKENDLMHKKLKEAEEELKKTRASTESASIMSDNVLLVLKKTAKELVASGELMAEEARLPALQCDGVQPFLSEVETIKEAFRSREASMTGLRNQLEMMKQSVAEAQKRKSLWQLASSAITVFAAASASVAYASRGH